MRKMVRFKGTDCSCGLRTGQYYMIEIIEKEPTARHRFRVLVNGMRIPYDTMNAIRKNWAIAS